MARIPIRELFRVRKTFLASPTKLMTRSSCQFASSSLQELELSPETEPSMTQKIDRGLVLLKLCQNIGQLVQIHAHLITLGLFQNPFWANRVLLHASCFGDIDYTLLVFRCINVPNTFCVNRVIKGYSLSNVPHEAVYFYFEWLRNGFDPIPDSFTFLSLFSACAKMGCLESGRKCHGQAVKRGLDCVLAVQNCLINMYGCCGHVELAGKVFDEMSVRDLVSWNSIVDVHARFGDLGTAHVLFDAMPERNVVSWNLMIGGYLKGGNPGCALKLFRKMVKAGLRGSDTTMVNVLTACARSASLNEGRSVHGSMIRTFFKTSIILCTALTDMYCKCQRSEIARRVFDKTENRNLVCWNAMIMGHCLHGNPQDGLDLFDEMMGRTRSKKGETDLETRLTRYVSKEAIVPDEITFIGVLCACARAGLLTDAKNYFTEMIDKFSIKPSFAHYWCLANVYVSLGLIQDAEEILTNLPEDYEFSSSASVLWVNLFASCRFHGDVSLGEKIAKSLVESEYENLSYYRLLMNIYATAGRWEDVARVKVAIKEKGMRRMPGCGLIDLKEIVHEFKVRNYCREEFEKDNLMIPGLAQKPTLLTPCLEQQSSETVD